MTKEEFLQHIEKFILRHRMTATEFGKTFCGDSAFVFRIRKGRSPSLDVAARTVQRMDAFQAKVMKENAA